MSTDGAQVIREVILGACEKPVLFMKQMAHHLIDIDLSFLARTLNVFLIRDPREMLPSLAKVIGTPMLADTGLKTQHDLFNDLRDPGAVPTGAGCAAPIRESVECALPVVRAVRATV